MRQCLHRELAIILQDFECVEQHEWVAVVEALLDAVADLAADETPTRPTAFPVSTLLPTTGPEARQSSTPLLGGCARQQGQLCSMA